MKQDKHIISLSQSDNYCYQNFVERYYQNFVERYYNTYVLLIIDHQIVCKYIIEIISFIEISFGGVIEI